MEAPVPGMYQLRHILEHVIQRFDDAALAQHDLVVQGHQPVLHVAPDTVHQMHPIVPQLLKKALGDISLVGVEFTEKTVSQRLDDVLVAVVHIGPGQHEVQYLALLVAHEMQLEADVPSHRAFAFRRYVLEYFHAVLPLVVDHRDAGAVNEPDARALPEADKVQEHDHRHETARLQLYKAVIRDRIREKMFPVLEHTLAIVVLEIAERVVVEGHHDGYHFGLAHSGGTIAPCFSVSGRQNSIFLDFSVTFFAEIVCNTK